MDRVFKSDISATPPTAPVSPLIGYPSAGNPGTGTPATKPGPWWYYMITEELRRLVVAAGLTPDHTNLDQVKNAVLALSTSMPAGVVLWFSNSAAPTGFLKANGAAVSRTTYAQLFSAIGTVHGAGDGSTTFNLPDLRGEFIRGWDDGRGVDSGRGFGTAQSHALASHSHELVSWAASASDPTGGDGFVVADASGSYVSNQSTIAFGGAETRPRNVALLACIKY